MITVLLASLFLLRRLRSTGSTWTEAGSLDTLFRGMEPFLLPAPDALKMGVMVTEWCIMTAVA
jgi:hypothetical protein